MLQINHAGNLGPKPPVTVSFGDKSFAVTYTVWAKLGLKNPLCLYGHLNEFLATLPLEVQEDLYKLQLIAFEESKLDTDLERKVGVYTTIVTKMSRLLKWNELHAFCSNNKLIAMDDALPAFNNTGNSNDNTFLQQEGHDIVVYSLLMKFLMPIFGPLCNLAGKTCGSDFKELIAIRILDKSNWAKAEPYIRLMGYSYAYAARENSGINSLAIHKRLSTNDIPYLMLGHILIRRLCIYPTRPVSGEKHVNIAAFISNHIKNGILDNFKNNPYDDKFKSDNDGGDIEDNSYIDRFRKSQDVPEWAILIEEYALTNIPKKLNELGLETEENINYAMELSESLVKNPHFNIVEEIHVTICGFIFRKVTAPQVFRDIENKKVYCNAIAIANLYLNTKGYPALAALLIAVEERRSMGQIDKDSLETSLFTNPNKELVKIANELYPYPRQSYVKLKTTPLLVYMGILEKRLRGSQWHTVENSENLSNEILSLFINEANK
jgi:hypothetical protein